MGRFELIQLAFMAGICYADMWSSVEGSV